MESVVEISQCEVQLTLEINLELGRNKGYNHTKVHIQYACRNNTTKCNTDIQ